jgi:hypothetical protein
VRQTRASMFVGRSNARGLLGISPEQSDGFPGC